MTPGFLNILCVLALLLCVGVSCKKIEPGNDPNFTIVKNSDKGFKHFKKKVTVFEIPIYAAYKVNDDRLLHAANILAQYLDNDEELQNLTLLHKNKNTFSNEMPQRG